MALFVSQPNWLHVYVSTLSHVGLLLYETLVHGTDNYFCVPLFI
jgi:hypothetical protein